MSSLRYKPCVNCGSTRDAVDIFCGQCGYQFAVAGGTYPTVPSTGLQHSRITPQLDTAQPASFRPRTNRKLIIITILVMMLVSAGFFVLGQFIKGNPQGTASNTSSTSSNQSGAPSATNKLTTTVAPSTPTPTTRYTAKDVYNAFVNNHLNINSHADDKNITVIWRTVGFPAQSTSGMLLNDASMGFSDSWPLGIYVFAQESDVQQDVEAIIEGNIPGPLSSGPFYFYAQHRCLLIGDQRMSLSTIAPYEQVMNAVCV